MSILLPLLASCARHHALPPGAPPPAWEASMDWPAAVEEAVRNLSAYLQVDTTNPPGNETRGALYLQSLLDAEGISSEILAFAENRGSLVARLPATPGANGAGAPTEPPLCLLSHIDVVTADLEKWPADKGPLSGVVDADGNIWGRGALDMKGMGILEIQTLIWLERLKVPLRREVILLAVADEEVDNQGIAHLVKHWDRIGCSQVINEGGLGIEDLLFPGQTAYAISVGEKGTFWAKMVASGPAGHGSTPRPGHYAPETLLRATDALARRKPKAELSPELRHFLRTAGESRGGLTGFVLAHRATQDLLVRRRLLQMPTTAAAITSTVHVTGFGGALQPNVVPSEVWALLDCRLLPGVTPEQMLAELTELTGHDPHLRFETLARREGNVSPWEDDSLYLALARNVARAQPEAIVGPVISIGFTDSIYLRPLGVHAYGFVPFAVDQAEMGTMHGHGEHVSTRNVEQGLRILLATVIEVAGAGDPDGAR